MLSSRFLHDFDFLRRHGKPSDCLRSWFKIPFSRAPTPNVDRLAASGMIFTDAHSSSSVCSPTRYGILTGRYNLANDIGEQKNVQAQHPHVVERLTKLLEKYVADGRSTPGATQSNTSPVAIYRTQNPADRNEPSKP
jgi:Sulfatase